MSETALEADVVELTAATRELLTILAEENAEVVQRCTKILRFDLRVNPWTGVHNRESLERELGDVLAIMGLLAAEGTIDARRISAYAVEKVEKLRDDPDRLRHAVVR